MNILKMDFRAILTIEATLILSLISMGCVSRDPEIIVVPRDYSGCVFVVFDQENGATEEYQGHSRIYRVPHSGMLLTQFADNPGFSRSPRFYYDSIATENEILYETDFKDIPLDSICACCGTAEKGYKDEKVVRFRRYFVGTKEQIVEASKNKNVNVLYFIK